MKRMNKLLSLVLAVCMLLTTFGAASIAAPEVSAAAQYEVGIIANSVDFHIENPHPQDPGQTETGTVSGSAYHLVESGKTLTDAKIKVWHDAAHDPYFLGWECLTAQYDADGNISDWIPTVDTNGYPVYMTTADMLAMPITADTHFEAKWQGKYTSFNWLTLHGNGGTFMRTLQDDSGIENREKGHDTFPVSDPGITLYNNGISKVTDPVHPNGKVFEGWMVYYHDPSQTSFTTPNENGKLYTSAEILQYTNSDIGYTTFFAKWQGESIDPNNSDINNTNTLISLLPARQVTVLSGGVPFMHQTPDTTGEIGAEFGTVILDGSTLEDEGISVWQYPQNESAFLGWRAFRITNTGDVDEGLLSTADMLKKIIDCDYRFEAEFDGTQPGNGTQDSPEIWLSPNGGSFEITDGNFTILIDEETTISSNIGETMADFTGITDIVNFKYWDSKRAFVGWNIYDIVIERDGDGSEIGRDQVLITEKPITTAELFDFEIGSNLMIFEAVWAGDDADYETSVEFSACGGEFKIQYDPNDPNTVEITEMVGDTYRENGKPLSEQISFTLKDPVHPEGYTFEGWLMVNQRKPHYTIPSTLYTTQQIFAMNVPAEDTTFLAKWKEIPMDEYLYRSDYPMASERAFLMNGAGGEVTLSYDDGYYAEDWVDYAIDLWPQENLSIKEALDIENFVKFEITASRNGHEFLGWTVYTTDPLYIVDAPKGEAVPNSGYTTEVLYDNWYYEDETQGVTYAFYKNKTLVDTDMTTEELMNFKSAKDVFAVANWKFVGKAEAATVPVEVEGSKEEYQLVLDTTLKVPAAASYKYQTPAEVQQALLNKAQENSTVDKEKAITVYYEIKLQVKNEAGTWVDVSAEDFPKNGVQILIPYIDGADPKYYDFVLTHLISSGDKAGEIEIVPHKETEDGLLATVYSLSPFAVTFQEGAIDPDAVPTPTPTPTPTPAPDKNPNDVPPTGDANNMFFFLAIAVLGTLGMTVIRRKQRNS